MDDQVGVDNGWAEALRITLGHVAIRVEAIHPSDLKPPGELGLILRQYDLVLLDLCLPTERDGLGMLSECKRAAPEVPVVIFTASRSSRPVRKALSAGASDYFLTREGRSSQGESRFEELVHIINDLQSHFTTGVLRNCYERIQTLGTFLPRRKLVSRLGPHAVGNIQRILKTAWAYLSWAEYGSGSTGVRRAWDQWILDGMSLSATGTIGDGCCSSVVVLCGVLLEGLGGLACRDAGFTATEQAHYLDQAVADSPLEWHQTLPHDICRTIWKRRCDAAHGRNAVADLGFSGVLQHLEHTIGLAEWFIRWRVDGAP